MKHNHADDEDVSLLENFEQIIYMHVLSPKKIYFILNCKQCSIYAPN